MDILIRDVPDDLVAKLSKDADRNRRSREKHALFLIEQALHVRPADTCGEMLEMIERDPVPKVREEMFEVLAKGRGRRSNRS
ncbi:MAG TPA: hypothetical protein VH280_14760 [Verrucomicrobiae bacterium]|jgi:hypothetical protein|nr:hypothetical protein [Verrucomicrobiae bacterium]